MGSDSTAMTSAPRGAAQSAAATPTRPPAQKPSPPYQGGAGGVAHFSRHRQRVRTAKRSPASHRKPAHKPSPPYEGGAGGVAHFSRHRHVCPPRRKSKSQAHPQRMGKSKSMSKSKSKSATTAPILRVQLPEDIRHVPSPIANDGRRSAAHTARHVPASESHSVPPRRPTSGGPFDFCQQFQPRCQVAIRPLFSACKLKSPSE